MIRRLGLDSSFAAEGNEQLAANAICSICHDYFEDVVEVDCQARHIFCRPCVTEVLDRDQPCPECRGEISEMNTAHTHIRSFLEQVRWKCFNFENGCAFRGTKKQLEEHLDQECQEHQQKCKFQGCQERRRRASIGDHERECPLRPIPCDHCTNNVPFQSMVEHLTVCEKVPVPCPNACGKNPLKGEVSDHLDTECSEHEILCEVPGCGQQVKRKEMDAHEEGSQKKHVKLLTQPLLEARRRNENHEREIEGLRTQLRAPNIQGQADKDTLKVKVCLPDYEQKAAASEKGSRLDSTPFLFQGFKFRLWVYPKGKENSADGQASIFLVKLHDYAMEMWYSLEAGGKRMEFTSTFDEIEIRGGLGWKNFCASSDLISAARRTGGALEISVSLSAAASAFQPLVVRGYG
uniref:RING-type domain-containing protein n=1 Tax=Chromera velia CCMP2878 TaxID=1169474 RepID=A0A0G4I5J2_9ALVE|eukprot:Cvel_11152.t1-p1 / transcript=Cvel_11152.t1 / gene=Cvel_11152 / organism=Chromera_velia_CCMP2878 / gene_product=TNF receptor-associated factor family protein, putative / transcript_product=TNF receptor-associated factor family protein, putative / location=Cvel_scaffold691:66277-69346(+) / protein_length=405 / sequence_SO=supercontig / SO=protein_coding / is_pseudo=false